ncbi:hypothetical protein OG618_10550 [Kitasatospora sp. NBC_01246]|uniref:hypothetical protein n=1 Tax=Kitasatospora sp. NBC_01246 TaxID=2903570 RepID=UPI002E362CD1|nr:hypothetical protein [Kitasatospora sp. NBC_01246]
MTIGESRATITPPPLWRPLRHLHHRFTEERMDTAARDLRVLGQAPFDADRLRRSLTYDLPEERPLVLLMVAMLAALVVGAVLATAQGSCIPGGRLPGPGEALSACPTHQNKVTFSAMVAVFVLALLVVRAVSNAREGVRVKRCYRALLPSFDVLSACARALGPGAGHPEAAELSKKAAALGQAVVDAAGHIAGDFGARASTRNALRSHARDVAALLESTADRLLPEREEAIHRLAALASAIARQSADGRFTDLLGPIGAPPRFPVEAPESPDRTDGKRLALAVVAALFLTTALAVGAGLAGLPAPVNAPLAAFTVPLITFLLLAYRHGLVDALRLVSTLRAVRSPNTPPDAPTTESAEPPAAEVAAAESQPAVAADPAQPARAPSAPVVQQRGPRTQPRESGTPTWMS